MFTTTLYSLAAVASFISYADADACTSSPYSSLSCLKNNKIASSACSLRLSIPATMVPVNAPVVTVTNTHTSTVFITTSSLSYSISTSTILATMTETTYVPVATPNARRLRVRATACTVPKALQSLSAMTSASFATACSCIGVSAAAATANPKLAAGTSTTTVDAGLTFTSYVNIGSTQFSQTVTSTMTTTLSLAAPTYSHVYQAAAGCQDTPTVATLQLDSSITDNSTAVEMCQEACSQNGKCSSLFVQKLFVSFGSAPPTYKCFMNGQSFVESSSLVCGLPQNIWGVADAYDAVARGVPY